MAATPWQVPLTLAEYEHLPEVIGFKDELIEGERFLSPSPRFGHNVVLDRLQALLNETFASKKNESPMRVVREAGLPLRSEQGVDSLPEPDLMIVSDSDYQQSVRARGWFEGIPLYIIEISSPSERKSKRMQKVGLYLDFGIEAVVEIDYTRRTALVHRRDVDAPIAIPANGDIEWPFQASLSDLLKDLPD